MGSLLFLDDIRVSDMKQIRLLLPLLIVFVTSCDMKKSPIKMIVNLQEVSEVQILSKDQKGGMEIKKVLTTKDDIDYFKKTFEIAKNQDGTEMEVNESLFVSDGEIRFLFENGQQPFVVEYDLDKGYKVEIESIKYYKQFTYRTGRYLAESQ